METRFDITVSIVLYNTELKMLNRALQSFAASKDVKIRIVLVDNSPQRIAIDKLIKSSNVVIDYIYNSQNLGFGKAHNIAIKSSINNSKYHLIANPDIYFNDDTLNKIFKFMETNKDIGLVMPKILYPNGDIQYLCKKLPTPRDLFLRRFVPLKFLSDKINNKYELRYTGYNKIMDVPCLSGCFMFIRTDVLQKTGGFDESFFMYLEDVDLTRRIGKISRTVFYPDAFIYHDYQKGSYKNTKLLYYHIRSAVKYFNKWGWF